MHGKSLWNESESLMIHQIYKTFPTQHSHYMVYNNYTEQRLATYAAAHDDNNEYESSHM